MVAKGSKVARATTHFTAAVAARYTLSLLPYPSFVFNLRYLSASANDDDDDVVVVVVVVVVVITE